MKEVYTFAYAGEDQQKLGEFLTAHDAVLVDVRQRQPSKQDQWHKQFLQDRYGHRYVLAQRLLKGDAQDMALIQLLAEQRPVVILHPVRYAIRLEIGDLHGLLRSMGFSNPQVLTFHEKPERGEVVDGLYYVEDARQYISDKTGHDYSRAAIEYHVYQSKKLATGNKRGNRLYWTQDELDDFLLELDEPRYGYKGNGNGNGH